MSDEELIRLVAEGRDSQQTHEQRQAVRAWEELVVREYDRVRGLVVTFRWRGHEHVRVDPGDHEDVTQKALERLLRALRESFEGASVGEFKNAVATCVHSVGESASLSAKLAESSPPGAAGSGGTTGPVKALGRIADTNGVAPLSGASPSAHPVGVGRTPYMRVKLAAVVLPAAALAAFVPATPASRAGCTRTLSVGANVAGAVAAAPNGSTICLNSGSYGRVDLSGISRSGYVTIRSSSGRGASLRPQIANTAYVHLDRLTLYDMGVEGCSRNIRLSNSTFLPNQPGLYFDASSCGGAVTNYLVDRVIFSNVDQARWEGRLNFRDVNGAAVRNSFFGNGGYGDGIQTQGNSRNLTIGPNNTFDGITQSFCDAGGGAHCDAIQPQGGGATAITGNYFKNGDTYIMAPAGSSNVTTTDNVFDGRGRGYEWKIQFGSATSPVFQHNLMHDAAAAFDSKDGEPATTNAQVKDNVVVGYSQFKTGGGSGCTGCAFSYNLFDDGGSAIGSRNLIGHPSFVGGAHPSTYLGWKLSARSIGRNKASDGTDIGPRFPSRGGSRSSPFEVRVSAKRRQRLGRWVVVRVACPTRACTARAAGSVSVRKARGTRRFNLRRAGKRVARGKRVTLRLRLSRRARRAAKRALRRHRRVRARVRIRVHDAAGNVVVRRRTIKLRR